MDAPVSKMRMSEALVHIGVSLFGDKFNLNDPTRFNMYKQFFLYKQSDPTGKIPQLGEWDPRKGLMFCGVHGVGKSAMFKVFQQFYHDFRIADAEEIENYLKEFGEIPALKNYGYEYKHELLIDDIGSDKMEYFHYKNSVSIIGAILKQRNKLLVELGVRTHVTTNLLPTELKGFYNNQNYDRFFQSFNVIGWEGDSLRRM